VEVESLYREPERRELSWGALELVDVFQIFSSGDAETVALRGLDLRIEPAEFVAVFGPSGSGKSTMLSLAAGLDRPSAGEVRVLGRSLGRASDDELAALRARDLALVFQGGNLWPWLSARENVELMLKFARCPADAREVLSLFGLSKQAERRAGTLSGGEQQRVAVAGAAARRASLVLADEPTAELDEANEAVVLDAFGQLRDRGSTVVVVTHSERVAERADRVVEVLDGMVV
jgi:putative ABC transport system ATP-binding protein